MLGIDISKYTSPRSPTAMQRLKDAGQEMAIIQSHPPGYGPEASLELMRSCNAVELAWDAYIYGYCGFPDWAEGALGTLDRAQHEGLQPLRVWYDIEDVVPATLAMTVQQRVNAYNRDLTKIDHWCALRGLPRPGVYSGKWYFDQYLPGVWAWADRDLWDSDYDQVADNEHGFRPYGGWTRRAIKQYIGTSTIAGVSGLDQNALGEQEANRIRGGSGDDDVKIPQEYQDKFGCGPTDVDCLIANFEGVIATARELAFAEGQAQGQDAVRKLAEIARIATG
jgi:hypothetical protein